jgi:hypothetical protein
MAAALGLVLVLAGFDVRSESAAQPDRLVWLLLALAASGMALWASAGHQPRAEAQPAQSSHADLVAFEPRAGEAAAAADSSLGEGAQISGTS